MSPMGDMGSPSAHEQPPSPAGLWHHREFRRLWIGETVSQFGTMVSQLALPLVAILVVHAPTFQVGLLTACETAAFLIVGRLAARRVDGPDAVPLGAHRQRPAPRGAAGLDPARAVPGGPDDLAAV